MTYSRLTDPEVLEFRFPVLLESYAIRAGSGGAGRWRGGDGGVRRVRFLETMTASILSNGRVVPAFGIDGGQPGALGINRIERRRARGDAGPHRQRRDGAGRRVRDRDAGRGWVRPAVKARRARAAPGMPPGAGAKLGVEISARLAPASTCVGSMVTAFPQGANSIGRTAAVPTHPCATPPATRPSSRIGAPHRA